MPLGARARLLRERQANGANRVSFVELFFDLVFVFAVTQLSHALIGHFTPLGLLQTTLLFLAVWWVWIYTTWVTNWVDPERTPVRLMLFALTLAGLIVSISIPKAFEARGLSFACAYAFMQVGRCLFMLWALRRHSPRNYRNFQRITIWLAASGVVWVIGGFADGHLRLAIWIVALAIEYASPLAGFFVPGLGRSKTVDWDVEGSHMSERCGLFIIIALGESILITGATFANLPANPQTMLAAVVSFVGSVAMWWIYFNIGAHRATQVITHADDPGRLARAAYTYMHMPIVGGIIVAAVADELVLVHPDGPTSVGTAAAVLGGPALYLFGNMLFKRSTWLHYPLSHLVGLGLLTALAPAFVLASPLGFATGANAVLVLVAVWETVSLGTKPGEAAKHGLGEDNDI